MYFSSAVNGQNYTTRINRWDIPLSLPVRFTLFFQELQQELCNVYDRGEASAILRLLRETRMGGSDEAAEGDEGLWNLLQSDRNRLLQGEPVQYVLEESWFYGNRFRVGPGVLIPRPETEELVDWILKDLPQSVPVRILDIGTGSGCIAITLKKKWNTAEVTAIDISETALDIARKNAENLKTDIRFVQADITDEKIWNELAQFDILVSNPPYIPRQESYRLHRNVVAFEPHEALFVPDADPLLFYRAITALAEKKLHPEGRIYVETHQHYAKDTRKIFQEKWEEVTLRKDLNGNNRMLRATRFRLR
jgi:release factor glutamine methyltransferase